MNCHSVWRNSTSTPAVGLVQHDDFGFVNQRLGHHHAALHATRKLAHVGIGLVGQPEAVDRSSIQSLLLRDAK